MGPVQIVQMVALAVATSLMREAFSAVCPDSAWEYWEGACYFFSANVTPPSTARPTIHQVVQICQAHDAKPVVLNTEEEARFVVSRTTDNVLLGCFAYTIDSGRTWTCVTYEGLQNGPWAVFPDSQQDATVPYENRCVYLNHSDPPLVFNHDCESAFVYVCEQPVENVASLTTLATEDVKIHVDLEPSEGYDVHLPACTWYNTSAVFVSDVTEGRRLSGNCIQNHVIDTKYTRDVVICMFSCLRDARCKSVNFYASRNECDLNFVGRKEAKEQDVVAVDGCRYYG